MTEFEFEMPKMGESITEAKIISWLKDIGDFIEVDEPLLEVATDKVDSEVASSVSGVIKELLFSADDVVGIGEVIAIIETGASNISVGTKQKVGAKSSKTKIQDRNEPIKPRDKKLVSQPSNLHFSPLVINIAKEYHISFEELSRIPASGSEGRLRKSDVMNYIAEGRPYKLSGSGSLSTGFKLPDLNFDKGKGKIVEMDRMRQMIADHMVFSKYTSPHVTAYVEADLTNMAMWRTQNKEAFQKIYGEKLTFTPLFVECVAKAIQDFPMINSSLDGKNIIVKDEIHIGMATALPSGNLIVPVVKNADKKSLIELVAEINSLTEKARDGKLKPEETKGSTFTISNVGTFGSVMGTPIINQPEAAILATGIIKKRAEVMERIDGDSIEIRQMMYLSLSFDHRIVDGYLAGSFLRRVADYMEQFDIERKIKNV